MSSYLVQQSTDSFSGRSYGRSFSFPGSPCGDEDQALGKAQVECIRHSSEQDHEFRQWTCVGENGGLDMQSGFQGRKKRSGGGAPALATETGACPSGSGAAGAVSCRERLQKHRVQVAGKVRIPETWGREALLREWASSRDVEEALQTAGILSARAALISACPSRAAATATSAALISATVPCEVSCRLS